MSRDVSVNSEPKKYGQTVSVGPHVFHSDEPSEYGGSDEGPTAIELLMSALGVCASVTVQMYAERRQWPLRGVHVEVSYARAPAEDYREIGCEYWNGGPDRHGGFPSWRPI